MRTWKITSLNGRHRSIRYGPCSLFTGGYPAHEHDTYLWGPLDALLHPGEGEEDPLLGDVVEEAEAAGVALDEGVHLEAAQGRQGDAVALK